MKFKVEREVLDLGLKIICITIDNVDTNVKTEKFLKFKENAYKALTKKYNNFDIETDLIFRGFNKLHKKINIKRKRNTSINELILKKFLKDNQLPSENKLIDLYNIVVLDSRLPIFIYDKNKITGDIHLCITKTQEPYITASGDQKVTAIGEYIYKDQNQIIQKLETDQNPNTTITNDTQNILIIIEGNEDTSAEYLIEVASEIIDLITTYCGGNANIIYQ